MRLPSLLILTAITALSAGLLAGCGEKPAPTDPNPSAAAPAPAPAPSPTAATPPVKNAATVTDGRQDLKEAVCVVCAVNGGQTQPEAVKASIEYKGKGYYFCDEAEKAEFISNPAKYVQTSP